MEGNHRYPYPPLFTMDSARGFWYQQHAAKHHPEPVPCWNFPPARLQAKAKTWRGLSSAAGTLIVLVFFTVFTALGLGTYEIMTLQKEMIKLKQEIQTLPESSSSVSQMLVGYQEQEFKQNKNRQAAHLIGKKPEDQRKILRWESRHGRAFTDGILYQDGGLQVNETGLYFVYSRVEFLSTACKPRDSLYHLVYVKRTQPVELMRDTKVGFCHKDSKEVWTAGSNLGSVHQLKKHEWLFVNVSHPTLLSTDYTSNYFGLFKLP